MTKPQPFWQSKSFSEMTHAEWESICDGCGKCCLHKLIDSDDVDETVHFTDIACVLLDCDSGLCSNYAERKTHVPDCVVITPDNIFELDYLPQSCGYRRLAEGRDLPSWHPLRHDGSRQPMMDAGMSVAGRCINESEVHEDLELRIVTWPLRHHD
ncbi:YcgN family cysteine cluster protein [Pseudidiomarina salilacus]|uniref:YcgN family cysteine cluster protein n=1 Tax=Pseudidiomarina salilacus TaxID=3384452 RepID=UPI00398564F3